MNAFNGIGRGVKMTASRAISHAHVDNDFRLGDFIMRSENTVAADGYNSIRHVLGCDRKRGVGAFLPVSLSRTNFFSYGDELNLVQEFEKQKSRIIRFTTICIGY
jgi:hypothetical protein